jgi:L-ascorbate metabolism protein UlaG (beta-lactamase superfamily)
MRCVLAVGFAFLFVAGAPQDGPKPALELVYLANEGFLARVGEHTVAIDAFVTEPYGGYAAVPKELFADLVARKGAFGDLDLLLVSHAHPDHFQPKAAAEFLAAHSDVPCVTSPQVLEALGTELSELPKGCQALLPEAGAVVAETAGGIRVELLRLPHAGGARTASVENLGHLIELDGVRLLHVGDADVERDELAAYGLSEKAIDVALVPYWWLGDTADLVRVRERIGAKHLVAVHVPPAEVGSVKARLAALDPALLVFERPGEARTLALER